MGCLERGIGREKWYNLETKRNNLRRHVLFVIIYIF